MAVEKGACRGRPERIRGSRVFRQEEAHNYSQSGLLVPLSPRDIRGIEARVA